MIWQVNYWGLFNHSSIVNQKIKTISILYVLFFFTFTISPRLTIGISAYLLSSFRARARKGGRKGKTVIKHLKKEK